MYRPKNFADIAYNTPLLIEVNVDSGICIQGRYGVVYLYSCKYNGKTEYIQFGYRVHNMIEQQNRKTVYLFTHAKAGIYDGVDRASYFRNIVKHDFLTKKEFEELKKEYSK